MSVTVVTVPVTVTASQSVVVVTSTIAASDLPSNSASYTAVSASIASSATAAAASNYGGYGQSANYGGYGQSASGNGASSDGASSPTTSASFPSNRTTSAPIGAIVGGSVGGVALIAFLVVLACLLKKRRRERRTTKPFPPDENESGPSVIAGLPPNPSTNQPRPTSGSYNHSIAMTEAASSLPLLSNDRSLHSSSNAAPSLPSDALSSHMHRQSNASLAPSFIMGSSASYQHSHLSHFGSPLTVAQQSSHDHSPAAFAAGYPDVHRSAFYEPHVPSGVDPRAVLPPAIATGSAAAAYHSGGAASGIPGLSPPHVPATVSGASSLPMGAAPADYAAISEAARLRDVPPAAISGIDPAWSGAPSLSDASNRRGSYGSALAMLAATSPLLDPSRLSQGDHASPQRRPPAAGMPGPSNLSTIPGSVAVSEAASADHQSMHSPAFSHRSDLTAPPKLPSIPASSPLVLQDASSFAPQASAPMGTGIVGAFGVIGAQLTAEPGTDTLRFNDLSAGTYNSDGTYNTYTGATKGQLRVVGSDGDSVLSRGPPTIREEGFDGRQATRDMSGDSKNGEFWVDAQDKLKKRLGQDSANTSTTSINKTGSRMIEMLDTDEQPEVPASITDAAEPSPKQTESPRPSFWKERTKSSQSISKALRGSPRVSANGSSADPSPALAANGARMGAVAGDSPLNGWTSRSAEPEHLPPLDLGRSVTSSGKQASEADSDMWKESSSKSKSKPSSALRKWTTKKRQSGSKVDGPGNEIDIDQLFG